MLELHNAVPMMGAVLVTLNTRLSEDEMAAPAGSLRRLGAGGDRRVCRPRPSPRQPAGVPCFVAGGSGDSYEEWIADAGASEPAPSDERQLLAINYTSGTTAGPKA